VIPFSENLRVVLVSPRNPLNIGAAARAISNFGFTRLRVVNAYDVAYKEARSAVKASAVMEASEQFDNLPDAIADCHLVVGATALGHRELEHSLHRLERAGRLVREALAVGPVAFLFGSEKFGLSNDDMSYCHWLTRIPTRPEHESMNLGQAVAVCLYELVRSEEASQTVAIAKKPAEGAQIDRFHTLLYEVLERSGYVNEVVSESSEQKLRRMVRRLELSAHDAYVWLGMLRQIRWKLDHKE
jgi:TrmH family RNA methyltransferase